jgi:hypothetical protein
VSRETFDATPVNWFLPPASLGGEKGPFMRSTSMRIASFVAPVSVLLWSGLAAAQALPTPEPPPLPDPVLLSPAPVDLGQVVVRERVGVAVPRERVGVEVEGRDGLRSRIGFSVMGGATLVEGATAATFGGEARIGVQINNLVGVYGTPHFVVGNVGGGLLGTFGLFAGTGDVDFTFLDHFYVGAGAGFGIVNKPAGPVLHLRLGGYPLVGKGENGYRRKGLQLGADMRVYFTGDPAVGTATEITGGIGYEAF